LIPIDFEAFYDFGMSWHENRRLPVIRIDSLVRQSLVSDAREATERYRAFRSDLANNPNTLWRFLQG
jgi:hypothetical protein